MDPTEQAVADHTAPTDQHSQDQNEPPLHPPPSQSQPPPQPAPQPVHVQPQHPQQSPLQQPSLQQQPPPQHVQPPPPDRQTSYQEQHRRQLHHMQIHQQQHLVQARAAHTHAHAEAQRYAQGANVIMRIPPQHQVQPQPGITRTSSIVQSLPSPGVGASSSTSKLWEHFIKGEKMQKTNKFFAHCIYCRKVNRDSATRGERRMMSAHLSTCSEAPEEARAEGLAISKDLKIRRSILSIGKKQRDRSSMASPIPGVAVPGKRTRRSTPSLHPSMGAGPSAHDAMIAAAQAAVAVQTQPDPGAPVAQPYFDPGLGPPMLPGEMQGPELPRSGNITTSDNVRLYYEDFGSGHPLILIHGLAGSCKFFEQNFRDLASSFRVIRFDLRGHGDSEKPQYGFHVHRLAADLHDILEHFSFEKVALLGCSLGCAVIWAFVELYGPSQISAAMFVDQSPYQMASADGAWQLGSKSIFSEGSLAHVRAELTNDPRSYHEKNVRTCFTRNPTDSEISLYVNECLKSQVWFTSKLMANHSYMDWRTVLPLVSCPALVIAGKKSKVFPWEGVAYAANNMPHAKLIPFEEGSHWLYIEEAVRFNSTVAAFLRSIVAGT